MASARDSLEQFGLVFFPSAILRVPERLLEIVPLAAVVACPRLAGDIVWTIRWF